MWLTVYVSQEAQTAKKLVVVLRTASVMARMRRLGNSGGRQGFEVLVPQPEVEMAQNIIIDNELF